MSPLEKWVTLCEYGSHLKKGDMLGKTSHNWKKGSHLANWATLGEMVHLWKIGHTKKGSL